MIVVVGIILGLCFLIINMLVKIINRQQIILEQIKEHQERYER